MIKVYEPTEKDYSTNGLGTVKTYKCEEEKNISLNGWKVTVECPLSYIDLIVRDRIITAQTKEKGVQPFRIGNVEKKGRRIYFTANHVVFDISNYLLSDVRPTGLGPVAYAAWLLSHADQTMPFTAKGEASGTCPTREFVRKTVRDGFDQLLSDMPDIIIDPDGWDINVRNSDQVGSDRGQKVMYGRNLQDWQIVEKWDDVCTKILPEGPNGLTIPEAYVESDTQYDTPYTKTITFELPEKDDNGTEYTDDQKVTMLREKAKAYLESHKVPKVSYDIKSDIPQDLCINDTVTVLHPKFELKAHVQGYTYDCNSGRVKSLTFGNYDPSPASTYSSTINDIKDEIDQKANRLKTDQEKAIEAQTSLIKNLSKNGYVYIDENEIDILDSLPRDKAKNVWRWTEGGLGFSSTGVDGTFTTAITQDGRINADFITAGTISANLIKGGTMTSSTFMSTNKRTDEDIYRQLEIDRALIGLSSNHSKLGETLYNTSAVPRVRLGSNKDDVGFLELYDGNSTIEQVSVTTDTYHGKCGDDGHLSMLTTQKLNFYKDQLLAGGINIKKDGTGVGLYGPNSSLFTFLASKNPASGRDAAFVFDADQMQFSEDGNFCGVLDTAGGAGAPVLALLADYGDTLDIGHITSSRTISSEGRLSGSYQWNNNIKIDPSGVMHIYGTVKYGDSITLAGAWTYTDSSGTKVQYFAWS